MKKAVREPYYGYRALLRWIRKTFPVKRGYRFKTIDSPIDSEGKEVWAFVHYDDTESAYEISISKRLRDDQWAEVLVHEISHVIDIDRNGNPDPDTHDSCHRDSWGQVYAEVYREFFKWQWGRK